MKLHDVFDLINIAYKDKKVQRDGLEFHLHSVRVGNSILHCPLNISYRDRNYLSKLGFLHDIKEDSPQFLHYVPDYLYYHIDLLTRKENVSYDTYINTIIKNPEVAIVKYYDILDNLNRMETYSKDPEKRIKKTQLYRSSLEKIKWCLEKFY